MDTILGIAERLLITKKNDGGYEKGGWARDDDEPKKWKVKEWSWKGILYLNTVRERI